jgi:hypothetical protein
MLFRPPDEAFSRRSDPPNRSSINQGRSLSLTNPSKTLFNVVSASPGIQINVSNMYPGDVWAQLKVRRETVII